MNDIQISIMSHLTTINNETGVSATSLAKSIGKSKSSQIMEDLESLVSAGKVEKIDGQFATYRIKAAAKTGSTQDDEKKNKVAMHVAAITAKISTFSGISATGIAKACGLSKVNDLFRQALDQLVASGELTTDVTGQYTVYYPGKKKEVTNPDLARSYENHGYKIEVNIKTGAKTFTRNSDGKVFESKSLAESLLLIECQGKTPSVFLVGSATDLFQALDSATKKCGFEKYNMTMSATNTSFEAEELVSAYPDLALVDLMLVRISKVDTSS